MADYAVIIPAAGSSRRFGGSESKIFAKIDDRPVFLRTLELFVNRDDVCQTMLVIAPRDEEELKRRYGANLGFLGVQVVQGGARRCDSIAHALAKLSEGARFVAVHDAVRPCVSADQIDAVFAEAGKTGAAILAVPVTATLKSVSAAGFVEQTVGREGLYEAQTPQVFRRDVLEKAYTAIEAAGEDPTDDAELVQRIGHPVAVVAGAATNIKITSRADLALASAVIRTMPQKPKPKLGAFEEAQW